MEGFDWLAFDLAGQKRSVSFSGEVQDGASGESFRFDTTVALEDDWRKHPAQGELVLDAGSSRARVTTPATNRRRAWATLALDRGASGSYEQHTLRRDDLVGGDSELLFGDIFGFAGSVRGVHLRPFAPGTDNIPTGVDSDQPRPSAAVRDAKLRVVSKRRAS